MAQHLVRQRRARLGIAHRRGQAQHLHRLEHAFHVGAAAIIAAKPEPHAGLPHGKERRDAAFQFHVGERIEHDAGVGCGELLDLLARDPDAVHDVEPPVDQAAIGHVADQDRRACRIARGRSAAARASHTRACRPADRASRQVRRKRAAFRASSVAARTAPPPSAACLPPGGARTDVPDNRSDRGSAAAPCRASPARSAAGYRPVRIIAIGGMSHTIGENTTRMPASR